MGLSRPIREHLREREIAKEIREENADHLNQLLYLRDMKPQRKLTTKIKNHG